MTPAKMATPTWSVAAAKAPAAISTAVRIAETIQWGGHQPHQSRKERIIDPISYGIHSHSRETSRYNPHAWNIDLDGRWLDSSVIVLVGAGVDLVLRRPHQLGAETTADIPSPAGYRFG